MKNEGLYIQIDTDLLKIDISKFDIALRYFFNNLPSQDDVNEFTENQKSKTFKTARIKMTEEDEESINELCDYYKLKKKNIINLIFYTAKNLEMIKKSETKKKRAA